MTSLKKTALIKLRAVSQRITWYLGTRFPETVPLVFVVGFPKSGTVWASQLVADYLGLPFPRYSIFPIGFPAVVHGHLTVSDRYPRAVYVVRDPRDIVVSAYFHTVRDVPEGDHPKLNGRQRRMLRGIVNKDRVRENLPTFIRTIMSRPEASPVNWPDHVRTYLNRKNNRVGLLKYEELLADGRAHLAQTMEVVTGEPADPDRVQQSLDRFSFARQAGRKPGAEDRSSFLRKGQSGDWINHFSQEAAEILDQYCGEAMLELGYVESRNWVEQCDPLDVTA